MQKITINENGQIVILGLMWMAVQALALWQFGVVTNFEATKYLEQADHFLQTGAYTSANFRYYSVQILLIALSKITGAGFGFVVGIQLLVNALSMVCFYKIIVRTAGRKSVAAAFTAALAGMYYYQLYNVHLFTESLYFSFSILYLYGLLSAKRLNLLTVLAILGGIILLFFTRPVGLFFLPATFLYLLFRFWLRYVKVVLLIAGATFLGLFLVLLNTSLGSGGEFDFALPYTEGHVICGVPTSVNRLQLLDVKNYNSVQGLIYIYTHHWQLACGLFARRLLAFFGVIRSYYSIGHNFFVAGYFYTVYVLSAFGFRRWSKAQRPTLVFLLSLIGLTALTTALSCDEWHNRFLYAILPFLLVLAAQAFAPEKANEKR